MRAWFAIRVLHAPLRLFGRVVHRLMVRVLERWWLWPLLVKRRVS